MDKESIKRKLEIYTYKSDFEAFKKRNNLTTNDAWDYLRSALQVWAWADAYSGLDDYVAYERSLNNQGERT